MAGVERASPAAAADGFAVEGIGQVVGGSISETHWGHPESRAQGRVPGMLIAQPRIASNTDIAAEL